MDIIYHSKPSTWKNKMIEPGFNFSDSTIKEMSDIFETRVENSEPKEYNKESTSAARKSLKKAKKRKREDSNSSVVESNEESTNARRPSKKYCIFHGKYIQFTDSYKDLRAIVNKHKQKKNKNFRSYIKSNNEPIALVQKKFQKFVKNYKKR